MPSPAAERLEHACVGENTLCAFAEGQLTPVEAARVEEHLDRCRACGELVAHALATGGALASMERSRSVGPEQGPEPPLQPGAQVGRYVVLEPVGAGAMSTVYAAHDPELDRRVALKLLRAGGEGDDLRARLYREAKAMARLAHPNVITVYDVGVYGSQLFVAMELVAGGTLRRWLASSPRDWREIVATFVQAGRGLACAHAAGLVHRDFKPDNVLVGQDGRVRVTDFGLARAATHDDAPPAEGTTLGSDLVTTITRTGALVGTPAYMAPEQLRGEATDARADMFGFCVALYEALYQERPFEGRNVVGLRSSTAAGIVRPPPPRSDVPAAVRTALLAGLRPQPGDRHASMEDLLGILEAAAIAPVVPVDAPERPVPPPPRRRRAALLGWTAAVLFGVTALVGFGGRALFRTGTEPTTTEVAPPPVERAAPAPIGELAPAPVPVTAASPATVPVRAAIEPRTVRSHLPPPAKSASPGASAPTETGAAPVASPATVTSSASLRGATYDRE